MVSVLDGRTFTWWPGGWCLISSHLITRTRSEVGLKTAIGAHIKRHGQRRFRVKTDAGNVMATTWEVADVRRPLISAKRLFERRHRLVLDENQRTHGKHGITTPLERPCSLCAVRLSAGDQDVAWQG